MTAWSNLWCSQVPKTVQWLLTMWSSLNSRWTNLESLHQDHFRYVCLYLWTAGRQWVKSRAGPRVRLSEQAHPLFHSHVQGHMALWLCGCPRLGSGCCPERKVHPFGYTHAPLTFTQLLLQTHTDLTVHVPSPLLKVNQWLKFEEQCPVIPLFFLTCGARTRVEFSLDAPYLGGFVILGPQAPWWFQESPPFAKLRISTGTSENGLHLVEDGVGKGEMSREDETVGSRILISLAPNCPRTSLITLRTSQIILKREISVFDDCRPHPSNAFSNASKFLRQPWKESRNHLVRSESQCFYAEEHHIASWRNHPNSQVLAPLWTVDSLLLQVG